MPFLMPPMKPLLVTAATLVLTAAAAGCQSTNTYASAERPVEVDPLLLSRIETDPGLAKVARVTGAREKVPQFVGDGPYVAQVEVTNRTGKPQKFLYQWDWVTPDGLIYQSNARDRWQTELIRGGETVFLTGTAPTDDIREFRLKLTEP